MLQALSNAKTQILMRRRRFGCCNNFFIFCTDEYSICICTTGINADGVLFFFVILSHSSLSESFKLKGKSFKLYDEYNSGGSFFRALNVIPYEHIMELWVPNDFCK